MIDEIVWPFLIPLEVDIEDDDELDVKNTEAASKITSPAVACTPVEESWSPAAPEANDG